VTIGIYRIFHTESGKSYVGQSVNVKRRLAGHLLLLSRGSHHNRHLQSAYCLYGKESFDTEVLELCTKENLTEREQYWMDFYRPTGLYNLAPAAGSPLGYKHGEEMRRKVSQSLFCNKRMLGKKHSQETRDKMSATRKGKSPSETARQNLSLALKGRTFTKDVREKMKAAKAKPVVYNGTLYDSLNAAALASNVSCTTVRNTILRHNNEEYHYA